MADVEVSISLIDLWNVPSTIGTADPVNLFYYCSLICSVQWSAIKISLDVESYLFCHQYIFLSPESGVSITTAICTLGQI